ncbi:hypothetical protein D3C75_776500 [compost metagenome]
MGDTAEELVARHRGHIGPAIFIRLYRNDGILFPVQHQIMNTRLKRGQGAELILGQTDPVAVRGQHLAARAKDIAASREIAEDGIHHSGKLRFFHQVKDRSIGKRIIRLHRNKHGQHGFLPGIDGNILGRAHQRLPGFIQGLP